MIHALLPLMAWVLYFTAPNRCYKVSNLLLAILLTFIYGLEEFVLYADELMVGVFIYDGLWYDNIVMCLYFMFAIIFYVSYSRIQVTLSLIGGSLACLYAILRTYQVDKGLIFDPTAYYYTEVYLALTVSQLIAASGGLLEAVIIKILRSAGHEGSFRIDNHGAVHYSAHKDNP